LDPFFDDEMNIYALIVGGVIIAVSLIGSLMLYNFKKNGNIVKSIFKEI
jgi:heme/copper-type cytochrome/quinol oxidase subunit 4